MRVEEGSAVVKTFDGSRINLQTGSELTWLARRGRLLRNSQITVDQPTGSVAYDVAAGSQFNVGSPAAVVSAGGDTFELSVDPAGMSRLAVMDGQVRMDTASGSETVKRNEVIEAKPSEPPRRLPTMTPLPPTPPPARAPETAQPPKATRTAEPAPTSTQAPPANKPPRASRRPIQPRSRRTSQNTARHRAATDGHARRTREDQDATTGEQDAGSAYQDGNGQTDQGQPQGNQDAQAIGHTGTDQGQRQGNQDTQAIVHTKTDGHPGRKGRTRRLYG